MEGVLLTGVGDSGAALGGADCGDGDKEGRDVEDDDGGGSCGDGADPVAVGENDGVDDGRGGGGGLGGGGGGGVGDWST